MRLSDEQQAARDQIINWYKASRAQCLTLGGYAGTGKTTLIKHLVDEGFASIKVLTPSGKAAEVLRRKGVPAQTLHSFLYTCLGTDEDGQLIFETKDTDTPALMIVDEASMVSRPVYEDALAEGCRILWVGDHGQLEPVGDDVGLMAAPAVRLETIHRQALDSPILAFATQCRLGERPTIQDTDGLVVGRNKGVDRGRAETDWLLSFDQIIVAFNTKRVAINRQIRAHKNYTERLHVGEKVICLRNNQRVGLFNGMMLTVKRVTRDTIDVETDEGRVLRRIDVCWEQFNSLTTLKETPRSLSLFDYGYAITCHKAQGSEWSRVLVIEGRCDKWSMSRWRYTAATRAAKDLVYLTDDVTRTNDGPRVAAMMAKLWQ